MYYYFNYSTKAFLAVADPTAINLTGYTQITATEYYMLEFTYQLASAGTSRMNFTNTQVTEISSGNVYYVSPSFSFQTLVEAEVQLVVPALQLTNIKAIPETNTFDGVTVITLRNNAVDTALSLTIPAGSTTLLIDYEDISTANYDLLSVEIDTTASTTGRLSLASLVTEYIKI